MRVVDALSYLSCCSQWIEWVNLQCLSCGQLKLNCASYDYHAYYSYDSRNCLWRLAGKNWRVNDITYHNIIINHYTDVIWESWYIKSLVVQLFVHVHTKHQSITDLLWGESTGDQWIPWQMANVENVLGELMRSYQPSWKCHLIYKLLFLRNSEENMYNFVISTVPADGLAPSGARPSAGTMMTWVWYHIYTGQSWTWRIKT